MEKNSIYRVNIIDTNENAVGVAKIDGAAVFVPGLVRGDVADVRIVSVKKNYALAECVALVSPSEYRIESVCPLASECGGCTLSHVTYEYENEIKRNTVKAAFRRASLPYDVVGETVFAPSRTCYRNKITLHYSREAGAFGLYREKTNDVIPFTECLLCSECVNEVIRFINENVQLVRRYSPTSLEVRESTKGEITVSLRSEAKDDEVFRSVLCKKFPEITVIFASAKSRVGSDRHYVEDSVMGLDLIFSTDGFRQVNDGVFEKMISIVTDFAAERGFKTAFDLYCGSGVIGLFLARHFKDATFYGIEINPESIKDAKKNAEKNGITNIEFYCGDAAELRRELPEDKKPEFVVVDPPRAGLSEAMRRELLNFSPERIVYVSCNPQTLARDLANITAHGYAIMRAIPLNMFPMTKHIESIVCLERKTNG